MSDLNERVKDFMHRTLDAMGVPLEVAITDSPDGVRVEDGHIVMPDLPGIGFEGKSDLSREMKALAA